MTEQREACAELARAMGATNFREITLYSLAGPVQKLICDPPPGKEPNVRIFDCAVTKRPAFSTYDPPDYFTDPAASRELVLWLATQERSIQREFVFALREATDEVDLCYELRLLTAEPSVIAEAACKALGIEVEE